MIRLIFTMFVTCVLLLVAGVWVARERTPELLTGALAPMIERTRELAKAVPKLLSELEPALAEPGPKPVPPVVRTLEQMTPEEIDAVINEAVEEKIASYRERPFIEVPLEAEGEALDSPLADADGADPSHAQDEESPDQEEWASLIRRMLAVYRQVGPR